MKLSKDSLKWASLLFILLTCVSQFVQGKRSSIRLDDNGYVDVVVAIHYDVQENDVLINKIKEMFTEASDYLFQSTKHQLFFKQVTIVLPRSWTNKTEYGNAGNRSYENADVVIAPPNTRWAQDPYTVQHQGCGKEGLYIHLTDDLLLSPIASQYYGPLGRVLVHEWGHYRWGLFDEYADPVGDTEHYQEFYYSPTSQQFEGVRCSTGYKGVPTIYDREQSGGISPRTCTGDPDTGYEDGFIFVTSDTPHDVSGSIMFGRQYDSIIRDNSHVIIHWWSYTRACTLFCNNMEFHRGLSNSLPTSTAKVDQFCDDSTNQTRRHNKEAPNKQNRLCQMKSNWEVMLQHSDFRDTIQRQDNPPVPIFNVVQEQGLKLILLFDNHSGFFDSVGMNEMLNTAAHFIRSVARQGSRIGIATFDEALTFLRQINTDVDRQELIDILPRVEKYAQWCSIASALRKSGTMLNDKTNNVVKGGKYLLFTACTGDFRDPQESLIQRMLRYEVTVNVVAFTQQPSTENLAMLAEKTGGRLYYNADRSGSAVMHEALGATLENEQSPDAGNRLTVYAETFLIGYPYTGSHTRRVKNGTIFIDTTIGRNTEFIFSTAYNSWNSNEFIEVTLTSPSGRSFDSTYPGYESEHDFYLHTFKLQETAESGLWHYQVTKIRKAEVEVTVMAESFTRNPDEKPITLKSYLSKFVTKFCHGESFIIYAELWKGPSPVVHANIKAKIERPDGDPVFLSLFDNGAGADVNKNDGIYSRYFTKFTSTGYYGVVVNADDNDGQARVIDGAQQSRTIPHFQPQDLDNPPSIGNVPLRLPGDPPPCSRTASIPAFRRFACGGATWASVPDNYGSERSDLFPPMRIVDLRVLSTSFSAKRVALTWTAPGDDLDWGEATRYKIRCLRVTTAIIPKLEDGEDLTQANVVIGDLSSPKPSGSVEKYTIRVEHDKSSDVVAYACGICAVDEVGSASNFSNVVYAVLRRNIPGPSGPRTEAPVEPSVSTNPQNSRTRMKTKEPEKPNTTPNPVPTLPKTDDATKTRTRATKSDLTALPNTDDASKTVAHTTTPDSANPIAEPEPTLTMSTDYMTNAEPKPAAITGSKQNEILTRTNQIFIFASGVLVLIIVMVCGICIVKRKRRNHTSTLSTLTLRFDSVSDNMDDELNQCAFSLKQPGQVNEGTELLGMRTPSFSFGDEHGDALHRAAGAHHGDNISVGDDLQWDNYGPDVVEFSRNSFGAPSMESINLNGPSVTSQLHSDVPSALDNHQDPLGILSAVKSNTKVKETHI